MKLIDHLHVQFAYKHKHTHKCIHTYLHSLYAQYNVILPNECVNLAELQMHCFTGSQSHIIKTPTLLNTYLTQSQRSNSLKLHYKTPRVATATAEWQNRLDCDIYCNSVEPAASQAFAVVHGPWNIVQWGDWPFVCTSLCVCSGIWMTLVSLPTRTGTSWVWTRHCFQQDGVTTEAPLRRKREDQVWPCQNVENLNVIYKGS